MIVTDEEILQEYVLDSIGGTPAGWPGGWPRDIEAALIDASIFGPRPLRKPFKANRRLRCRDPLASPQARSRGRPRGPGSHP